MKRLTLLVLVAVAGIGLVMNPIAAAHAAENPSTKQAAKKELPVDQERVMIPVEGMTCGGCAASIDRSVKKLDGIVDIEIDHLKGSVTVVHVKDKVTVDQIVEAINKVGFKASKPKKS